MLPEPCIIDPEGVDRPFNDSAREEGDPSRVIWAVSVPFSVGLHPRLLLGCPSGALMTFPPVSERLHGTTATYLHGGWTEFLSQGAASLF